MSPKMGGPPKVLQYLSFIGCLLCMKQTNVISSNTYEHHGAGNVFL